MEGVKLDFTEDGLEAIAELALKRGTGARGLRAVLEESMLDVMYEIPSRLDVIGCTISRAKSSRRRRHRPRVPSGDRRRKEA